MAIPKELLKRLNPKEHKYHAKWSKCMYGHNHPSRKEAMWCVKLHELSKERKIACLVWQPKYEIKVNGILICFHVPDFRYLVLNGPYEYPVEEIIEVKGVQTPEWKLKHKLFCALYPEIKYEVV